ncbi:MAG: SUMF1/EgtB/PvdO family nonheme iron enzyme [bacterium]
MFPLLALGAAFVAFLSADCSSHDSSSESNESEPEVPRIPSNPPPEELPSSISRPEPSETKPASPCPEGMVSIDRFCIDTYEDHLLVPGRDWPANERPPFDQFYWAESRRDVYPQAYISREESEEACRRSAKRLCTLSEWLQACRGAEKFIYPYGNVEEKGRCNNWKPHLLMKLFGDVDPMSWGYESHFNNPILDVTPGFLAKAGEYAACLSPYHVYDMVGNLHEWVSDTVDSSLPNKIVLYENLLEKLPINNGHGIFMGGFFSTSNEHGLGCGFITIGHEPAYHDYSTGFRCCADAFNSGEKKL